MPTAAASGTFPIAGELEVHRLGFGAMRLTGPGITGPPADVDNAQRRPAPRRRARRQPHRHRRRVRAGRQRGADRRGAASVPGRPRHRDEGRAGAHAARAASGRRTAAPSTCAQACEGSLRRLRVERIDVYYLHRPDPEVPYEESVGALKELKDEGKIRHVAVSNVSVGAARDGPRDRRHRRSSRTSTASPTAARRTCSTPASSGGIGFVPWAPLDAGALDPAGPVARDRAERTTRRPVQIAHRVAAAHVAGDAADPGDVVARAPRGERRRGGARARRRRVAALDALG